MDDRHYVEMEREGLENVCKWAKEGGPAKSENPHTMDDTPIDMRRNMKIKRNMLDCVGNTPMVRCDNIANHYKIRCNLLAKCEFMNPGGSVKDRIGRRMVVDAEKRNQIKKGDTIIEPTSGNTGIGLSMAAAIKGYNMVITMPEKMSQEKQDALKGLGATIVRTPTEYAFDHKDSHIGIADRLSKELPNAHVLDQYKNPSNPMAHYQETGQEIWDQTDGNINYLVAGAGTGGTIGGIARKLKEENPKIRIIGVDPEGSILAKPQSLNDANPGKAIGQQTEGIGYDFIPRVLDRDIVDEWFKGPCDESFTVARQLLKMEGMMCGGSSGTAMNCAIKYALANDLGPDVTMVVVLPDNIRNYMTKHLNDDWMYERGYITEEECYQRNLPMKGMTNNDWGQDKTVADLDLHAAYFLRTTTTCEEAINLMRAKGFDQFPVKDENNNIYGVMSATNLLTRLGKNQLKLSDPIKRACARDLRKVSLSVKLNELVRILQRNSYVLVDNKYFITFSDVFDVFNPADVSYTKQEYESMKAKASERAEIAERKLEALQQDKEDEIRHLTHKNYLLEKGNGNLGGDSAPFSMLAAVGVGALVAGVAATCFMKR